MQVILTENIQNLGKLGDIVKVKNGFARNFLIPQKKAKYATKDNLAAFEASRAELEKQQAKIAELAKVHFEKLHGISITIKQKSGIEGKLFGSVTTQDVAKALGLLGVPVVKEMILLPEGHLKVLGDYAIKVKIHDDFIAEVTLNIISED